MVVCNASIVGLWLGTGGCLWLKSSYLELV